jgi:hypothetical protein
MGTGVEEGKGEGGKGGNGWEGGTRRARACRRRVQHESVVRSLEEAQRGAARMGGRACGGRPRRRRAAAAASAASFSFASAARIGALPRPPDRPRHTDSLHLSPIQARATAP